MVKAQQIKIKWVIEIIPNDPSSFPTPYSRTDVPPERLFPTPHSLIASLHFWISNAFMMELLPNLNKNFSYLAHFGSC